MLAAAAAGRPTGSCRGADPSDAAAPPAPSRPKRRREENIYKKNSHLFRYIIFFGGGPRSVMATTPDSHAGGPGFESRCRPTNFGAYLLYTPPPGHKDVSRVPKGMVYAKAEHPG